MELDDKEHEASPPSYDRQVVQSARIKPQARLLHDPAVTFEEYHYYALRTREEEKQFESPKLRWREIINGKANKDAGPIDGKVSEANFANEVTRLQITDEEWTNASRAMRTASCTLCFRTSSALLRLFLGSQDMLREQATPKTGRTSQVVSKRDMLTPKS